MNGARPTPRREDNRKRKNAGDAMECVNARIENLHVEDGGVEEAEYVECVFVKCVFANAVLRNVKFANCRFEDCVLRNASFKACSLLNGVFHNCALIGLDWSPVRRHGARLALLGKMTSCTVKYNTFVDVGLSKADFAGSILHDCYFQDCALGQASFRECDLRNTVFHHCDLSRADFRDARNYGINVMNNKISKARFSLPDAIGLLAGFDVVIE